jgi:hypothetical protein
VTPRAARTLILLSLVGQSAALTVTVTPDDPFREVLASLGQGDTLFLSPGTYSAADTLPLLHLGPFQDGVTITSDPGDRAVLDGQGYARPVVFLEGPLSSLTVVENLEIMGGNASGTEFFSGGGSFLSDADATVANCSFHDNTALFGGGISVEGGAPVILDCELTGNHALATGGGMNLFACSLEASGLRFTGNESSDDGAGLNAVQTDLELRCCLFTDNSAGDDGGGLAIQQGVSIMEFLTVHGNSCDDDGAGMLLHSIDAVQMSSCIVTENTGKGGVTIKGAAPAVLHTCCWGNEYLDWWGMYDPAGTDGNISSDPLYADSLLRLSQVPAGQPLESPAVDAGHLQVPGSCVEDLSTRTDSLPDLGTADMGFHYGRTAPPGSSPPLLPGPLAIRAWPSPSSGPLLILLGADQTSEVDVSIYDLVGRRIATLGTFQVDGSVELSWEPPQAVRTGVYLIRASSGELRATTAVVMLR